MFDKLISTAELEKRLSSPDLVLIDVRHDLTQPDWGEAQYRQAHVPGAIFAHLDRDLSARTTGRNGRHPVPSPEAAAATFGRLGIDRSKQVIAYDQGAGVYASRLWWMLRWLGHEAASVLDGGYAKWMREGRVVSSDSAESRQTTFAIKSKSPMFDAAAVQANLDSRAWVLVDARAPERFRGDVEPIDPVAGHIPGAINRPHGENMSADGTWKSRDALRAEFDALLNGVPAERVVHYCGSGVSACHNVLAMEIAGLSGARLYPGSWSEWSSDPSRPQARGT